MLKRNGVKTLSLAWIISLFALVSCQQQYYYHFPKEEESKGIRSDSLRWKYAGNTLMQVPVADDQGKLYWLTVTDKTKLDVTSVYGDVYRFNLRSIEVSNPTDGLFGQSATWTGLDLREHARRTIAAKDIAKITVLAEQPAKTPIN